jgi:hypothetical protein
MAFYSFSSKYTFPDMGSAMSTDGGPAFKVPGALTDSDDAAWVETYDSSAAPLVTMESASDVSETRVEELTLPPDGSSASSFPPPMTPTPSRARSETPQPRQDLEFDFESVCVYVPKML